MHLLLPLALLLQVTPVQPLPRGTGLPPATDADAPAVLATVERLLGAIEKSDGAIILANTRGDGGATVALERPAGERTLRHLTWAQFAAGLKPGPDRYAEGITDPAIEVDGDIAMVWAPYTVRRNGAVEHCGFDHFDLVRDAGTWKVLNVTWSQRTTGCSAG